MGRHLLLFALTVVTTTVSGAFMVGVDPLKDPAGIPAGLVFSGPLLAILMVHEMGHYLAARRHRMDVTPPYFIPFLPVPPLPGTMGAIIKMRSAIPHRNAMLDVGAAGPLAGAAVAIPVLFAGLSLSEIRPVATAQGIPLGESILFRLLAGAAVGTVPDGFDLFLHPVAYAGWLGLLITMLNLIPSGQLDGGHVAFALFGGRYGEVSRLVPFGLLFLGLVNHGWFVWAVLLFLIGTKHPMPTRDDLPLSPARKAVGALTVVLFLLCFTPDPFPG